MLVNSAGITDRRDILTRDEAMFHRMSASNTRAPCVLMQDAVRVLIRQDSRGSIVSIGSAAALDPADVARAVAFTLSDESGMMTGAVVPFDQSVRGAYQSALPVPLGKLTLRPLRDAAVIAGVQQAGRDAAGRLNRAPRHPDAIDRQRNLAVDVRIH
jgi:short chain dehydrogenase